MGGRSGAGGFRFFGEVANGFLGGHAMFGGVGFYVFFGFSGCGQDVSLGGVSWEDGVGWGCSDFRIVFMNRRDEGVVLERLLVFMRHGICSKGVGWMPKASQKEIQTVSKRPIFGLRLPNHPNQIS